MSEGLALNLIYRFAPQPANAEYPGSYEILHFFSDQGPVEIEIQQEVFNRQFPEKASFVPIFQSLDELKAFVLEVCVCQKSPEAFILSAQDYNIGVEAARELKSFREIYRRYGISITNTEIIQRSGKILGKIFGGHKK